MLIRYARALAALWVSCALVATGLLAASPHAHAWLHGDHDAPGHDCAAKHLADGKVLLAAPVAVLPVNFLRVAEDFSAAMLLLPQIPFLLPAERAPPLA